MFAILQEEGAWKRHRSGELAISTRHASENEIYGRENWDSVVFGCSHCATNITQRISRVTVALMPSGTSSSMPHLTRKRDD
jgi:hypothetical protein